jgi:hypothetical protein
LTFPVTAAQLMASEVRDQPVTPRQDHAPQKAAMANQSMRAKAILSAVYREHRLLLWICVIYIVGGGAALAWLDRDWPIRLTSGRLPFWWAVASLLWLFWQYLRDPRRVRKITSPERVAGAVLVVLLVEPVQITLQALKQAIGHVAGFPWDPWLHSVDLTLHGTEPWRLYARVLPDWSWVRAIDLLYVAWAFLLLGFLLWASWSHVRHLRQRALVACFLMFMSGATLAAWAGASAGPCYYEFVAPPSSPVPYGELLARLDAFDSSNSGLAARSLQRWLWDLHAHDRAGTFSGVSAMPSLHVAMAVLCALIGWQRSRIAGVLLAGYAAIIQLGSVLLAWHYAVDGYVGAVIAIACWVGAKMLLEREGTQIPQDGKPRRSWTPRRGLYM